MSRKKRSKKSNRHKPARTAVEPPSAATEVSWKPPVPKKPWQQLPLILVIVFLVYIPSLSVPWYFDDYYAIVDKEEHRSWEGIKLILREFVHRGVVRLSYALDWHVSDWLDVYETRTAGGKPGYQKPIVYHFSSTAYHLITVAGVFLLVRKALALFAGKQKEETKRSEKSSVYLPAVVALLYGALPINTEAVTYLSGRSSVLATAEYVFGVWALLIGADRFGLFDETLAARPVRDYTVGAFALLGTAACFVLGIGTKEIIVTMPVTGVLLLGYLIAHRFSLRTAIIRLVPACALVGLLLVGFFAYRVKALGASMGVTDTQGGPSWSSLLTRMIGIPDAAARPWGVNLLSQIGVIGLYYIPRQLCLRPLCIDPQVPVISSVTHSHFISGLLILCGLVVLGVVAVRRAPLVTMGLAWYFVSIGPTSSIIPLLDLAAERHTYLPNVGFVLGAVSLGDWVRNHLQSRGPSSANLVRALAVLVACVFAVEAVLTVQRNLLYTDRTRFWEDAARLSPGKERVHFHLAAEYFVEAGRPENAARKVQLAQKAEKACLAALEIKFDFLDAANMLGIIYMNYLEDFDKAARVFEECIKLWPEFEHPWINLGTCYLRTREFAKADELGRRWLARDPDGVGPRVFAANSLLMQGRLGEAEIGYLEILRTYGENLTALKNLAYIARQMGDNATAQQYENRAQTLQQKEEFKPIEVHGKHDIIQVNLP